MLEYTADSFDLTYCGSLLLSARTTDAMRRITFDEEKKFTATFGKYK